MKPPGSFLWHDYETYGAWPMADRPSQFAAQRTDAELNCIGDPVVWYCSPADDVLPHPMACLITGITPQEAHRRGVSETGFTQNILDEMMQPGTCSVGYNSIRFDDTVTRNLLYRNLRDPYEREYKNGNSRWDLIDLARMYYALRPAGIQWPMHEAGKPSFRLEDLSAENNIAHEGAHDALADVRATIDLARMFRQSQPRLFDWGLGLRDQKQVKSLLDPVEPKVLLHTSAKIPATRGCTSLVLPLAVMPDRPKSVIVFDLMADPTPLIQQPADVIHDLVFTPAADLPEGVERLPLKAIHSNHVPMVAPFATLKGVDLNRIQLNPDRCRRHAAKVLASIASIRHKVVEVFLTSYADSQETNDPDLMIYNGGFFSHADRHLMSKVLSVPADKLGGHLWSFQDKRLPLMLFRYRARNFPETLSMKEADMWREDRRARLIEATDSSHFTLAQFKREMVEARELKQDEPEAQIILDQLEAWVLEIGLEDM
jgi:exodeoxyribonuclease-1